jgi:hypothetical protein
MLAERPRIEQALQQVAGRAGLTVRRVPEDHAGGKWRLSYATALGRPGTIELDVNFMLRTPLWPAAPRDSRRVGGEIATQVLILDDHELAAGKLAVTVDRIQLTADDVDSQLVPMLRLDVRPARAAIRAWTEALVREARELMAAVLPLETNESEFLERLNGAGEIVPELLTADPAMQAIIRDHPGLEWKALNVKKHLGIATGDGGSTE